MHRLSALFANFLVFSKIKTLKFVRIFALRLYVSKCEVRQMRKTFAAIYQSLPNCIQLKVFMGTFSVLSQH